MSYSRSSRLMLWIAAVMLLAVPVLQADHHEEEGPGAEMQAMMEAYTAAATPGEQHAALAEQAGKYELTIKSYYGAPEPEVSHGTAERTITMDGRVLEEKVVSDIAGGQNFHGLGRTGYDNVTGKYWSTWTDTMSTGVTMTTGTWSDDGKHGTFTGESPDPMSHGMKPLRIEMTMQDDGTEVAEFYQPGPDGADTKTMEIVYEPVE